MLKHELFSSPPPGAHPSSKPIRQIQSTPLHRWVNRSLVSHPRGMQNRKDSPERNFNADSCWQHQQLFLADFSALRNLTRKLFSANSRRPDTFPCLPLLWLTPQLHFSEQGPLMGKKMCIKMQKSIIYNQRLAWYNTAITTYYSGCMTLNRWNNLFPLYFIFPIEWLFLCIHFSNYYTRVQNENFLLYIRLLVLKGKFSKLDGYLLWKKN